MLGTRAAWWLGLGGVALILAGCGRVTPPAASSRFAAAGLQRWQRARFDLTRAAYDQEQVVARDPRSSAAYTRLAQVMDALGHPRAALALAAHALRLYPGSATLQDNVGLLALQAGQWSVANTAYENAVRARPADWLAWDGLAAVAVQRAEWPAAATDLRRAEVLGGPEGATYDEWGRLLLAERQPAAALGFFQAAQRVSPGWWQPWYDAAQAEQALHNLARARGDAGRALALNPAGGPAVVLLATLHGT